MSALSRDDVVEAPGTFAYTSPKYGNVFHECRECSDPATHAVIVVVPGLTDIRLWVCSEHRPAPSS